MIILNIQKDSAEGRAVLKGGCTMDLPLKLPAALSNGLEEYFRCSLTQVRFFLRDAQDMPPAFAAGGCVVLRKSAYAPESFGTAALVAHEVCHLCQQQRGENDPGAMELEANLEALSFALWYFTGRGKPERRGALLVLTPTGSPVRCWGLGGLFSIKQIAADQLYRKDGIAYLYEGFHEYLTRRSMEDAGKFKEGSREYQSVILGCQMNDMYLLPKRYPQWLEFFLGEKGLTLTESIDKALTEADRQGAPADSAIRKYPNLLSSAAIQVYDKTVSNLGGSEDLLSFLIDQVAVVIYAMVRLDYFAAVREELSKKIDKLLPLRAIDAMIGKVKEELCALLLSGMDPQSPVARFFIQWILHETPAAKSAQWIREKMIEGVRWVQEKWESEGTLLRSIEIELLQTLLTWQTPVLQGLLDQIKAAPLLGEYTEEQLRPHILTIQTYVNKTAATLMELYCTSIFLASSHTGEMQFLHSMDCSGGDLARNREKMIRWGEFCRDVYENRSGIRGRKLYEYLQEMHSVPRSARDLLPSMLLPICCVYAELGNCRARTQIATYQTRESYENQLCEEICTALRTPQYRTPFADMTIGEFFGGGMKSVDPGCVALGMAMHMIEDSFTASHTIRAWNVRPGEASSSILGFADYTQQDAHLHAYADYFALDDGLVVDLPGDDMPMDLESGASVKRNAQMEEENRRSVKATVGAESAICYSARYLAAPKGNVRKLLETVYRTADDREIRIPPSGRCYEMTSLKPMSIFEKLIDRIDALTLEDMIKTVFGQDQAGGAALWESIDAYRKYLLEEFGWNRYPTLEDVEHYREHGRDRGRVEECRRDFWSCVEQVPQEIQKIVTDIMRPKRKPTRETDPTIVVLLMYASNDIPYLMDILQHDAFTEAALDKFGEKERGELIGIRERYLRHLNEVSLSAQQVRRQYEAMEQAAMQSLKAEKSIPHLAEAVAAMADIRIVELNARWNTSYPLTKQE